MASSPSPTRAVFDLARAGNFPSVASNVLAALVLSAAGGPGWPPAGSLALAVVAGCLIYAGGATLNDFFDTRFDTQHKPQRPIPRGVISRSNALVIGVVEMAIGVELLILQGASMWWGLALLATIVAYDVVHKKWVGSVILMAGCRVLLAVTVASLPGHAMTRGFLGWVAALFIYIVTLSLIARWEYKPGAPAAKIGRSVGRLLAFIPLIDAIALLLVGAWIPALACALAIPLGRWAQRLAAST
jgi:4-hydroxybenzoate polyprenyltransferase